VPAFWVGIPFFRGESSQGTKAQIIPQKALTSLPNIEVMRNNWMVLLAILAVWGCSKPGNEQVSSPPLPLNKFDNPQIVRLYDLADHRQVDSLLPYLSDTVPMIRREAALLFGSLQSAKAGAQLSVLLEDGDESIVRAAAWALGQIGDSTEAHHLLEAMQKHSGATQLVLGEALGKCGTLGDVTEALELFASGGLPADSRAALMQGVYRAGLRKRVPPTARAFAYGCLEAKEGDAAMYAAAFLGRVAELGEEKDPEMLLFNLRQATSAEVMQQLVKTLKRCPSPACTDELRRIASDTKQSPQTRANAFRAAWTVHDLTAQALMASQDPDQQVAVAAAEYLRDAKKAPLDSLLAAVRKIDHWRPRAIVLAAAISAATSASDKVRDGLLALTDSLYAQAQPYEKGHLLTALGQDPKHEDRLMEAVKKMEPIVSAYAMEALVGQYGQFMTRAIQPRAARIQECMALGDAGIVAMAADFISGGQVVHYFAPADTVWMLEALHKLKLPTEIETYNAVEKAIAKVKGVEPKLTTVDFQHPIDWALVKTIPTGQTATITTNKGAIVLQLKVEDAPGSVANFVELVRKGFYNGKFFHRVVPAFVAQGGCPRGDGWGSSPETIRSEFAPLHYSAGAVGMASAGKDTESCQWFITHCSVPHLDGRYTIFAEVAKGLDVVQQLEIGDQIVSIVLDGFPS
jgi:cyclophilin family peptidyl-prolyl cis-trans isomerase